MKAYRLIAGDTKHAIERRETHDTMFDALTAYTAVLCDHRERGTEKDITELAVYEFETVDGEDPDDHDVYADLDAKNVLDQFDMYAEDLYAIDPPNDFERLRDEAINNSEDREKVNRLGRWFEQFSDEDRWNGEAYDIGEGKWLYPIQVPSRDNNDSVVIVGYTLSSNEEDRFPKNTRIRKDMTR